jgi:hypothetical protein
MVASEMPDVREFSGAVNRAKISWTSGKLTVLLIAHCIIPSMSSRLARLWWNLQERAMTTRFSRRSIPLRHRRPCTPRLDALEVRRALSHVLPADGTILVATQGVFEEHAPSGIVEVNPATGAQSVLSSRGLFSEPIDLREAPNGTLYVVDSTARNSGAVISVNPKTGAQKLITSGGHIYSPNAIQYVNGDLFVADSGKGSGIVPDSEKATPHSKPNILEINPRTHKQTIVTQGGSLTFPDAIQPGPGDTIYVANGPFYGTGAIFQVNCATGQQTLIATGGYLNQPVDMALNPQGNLIVVDRAGGGGPDLGNVVSINPTTGAQTLISTGLRAPDGDSVDASGDIFVSTLGYPPIMLQARIVEINPSTGAQSTVTTGGLLDSTAGMVVFSRPAT